MDFSSYQRFSQPRLVVLDSKEKRNVRLAIESMLKATCTGVLQPSRRVLFECAVRMVTTYLTALGIPRQDLPNLIIAAFMLAYKAFGYDEEDRCTDPEDLYYKLSSVLNSPFIFKKRVYGLERELFRMEQFSPCLAEYRSFSRLREFS